MVVLGFTHYQQLDVFNYHRDDARKVLQDSDLKYSFYCSFAWLIFTKILKDSMTLSKTVTSR